MDEIPADLLPEDVERKLDLELLPTSALNRDVTALAGELDFTAAEINYICTKKAPFKFLLDQWCKREGRNSTLACLQEALLQIKRPDLAELIKDTVKRLRESSFNQLQRLSDLQDKRIERRNEDCTFVSSGQDDSNDAQTPLRVYGVYYPESDEVVEKLHKSLDVLRSEYGIDAYTNLTDKTYDANKQFFIFDNLRKADYVLVFCSATFKTLADQMKSKENPSLTDKEKEVLFALNFIVRDIYRNKGKNTKFIPLLLDSSSKKDIPNMLLTSTNYQLPIDFESLARRIFQIAQIELPAMDRMTGTRRFKPRITR